MKKHIAVLAAICMTAVVASRVAAATPEDAYIAARDAAIAAMKALPAGDDDDATRKREEAARTDLTGRLQAIIGPIAIKGLDGQARSNIETLFEGDQGFGTLDGLVFGAVDGPLQVVVTTEGLLRRWLVGHRQWWGDKGARMPRSLAAAAATNAFYTQAISTDAAVTKFVALPVMKPDEATFAFAMLAARSQDAVPAKADEVFVTVSYGGRVYLACGKASAAIGPIGVCERIRRESQTKSEAEQAKDERDFLRCFAERAPREPAFGTALKDAQDLIGRLPR
ncbi:hypothetical protein [Pseudolabrys taiwanensis]|nr:hypothetical protein [Pseudolabrys taiwanensis]